MTDQVRSKVVVQGEFYNGYSFKKLIETLASVVTHGNFIFRQDSWHLCELNSNGTIMVFVAIKTNELIDYEYNSDKEELVIGIDFENLHTHSKSIGKKNSLMFRIEENGSSENLLMVLYSENSSNSAVSPINIVRNDIQVPSYLNERPILVRGGMWAKICTSISQLSNILEDTVTIMAYEEGFTIEALESSAESIRTMNFGTLNTINKLKPNIITREYSNVLNSKSPAYITKDNAEAGIIRKIGLPKMVIKSLSRLDTLCHMGTMKFSFGIARPMKIKIKIATYGEFTIYLKSC
uniref:Proliferating cell nuclear antigen n=1 Tax=Pithovirus LCPAC403 TaxID=2506596 RepID=A0A481ZC69_9VIRU|nr:MAG: proliferating cell nuclear antigen [Pithovirus LCPAC403]